MALTIGFDATAAVRQSAGIGRYTRNLLSALVRRDELRFRVFYCGGGKLQGSLPPLNGRANVRSLPLSDRITNAVWHRAQIPLPVQWLTGHFDLFHSPDFTLPPAPGKQTILTVHDLAFLRLPECAYPSLRAYLEVVVPRSARRADHIIAVSEWTRRDVIELLGIAPEKVTTVPEGVGAEFGPVEGEEAEVVLRDLAIDRPYILSVGTLEPRKNYPRLIEAYWRVLQRGFEHDLVIAGGQGWLCEPLYERIASLGLGDRVKIVQSDDRGLRVLYSRTDAFVYPSLYEGFGIPVLEALACGAPVACSNTSSLPEVAGDAAVTFDPGDSDQIADAIELLLGDRDLSARLRLAGPLRAAGFSWDRAAEATADVYRRVANRA